MTAQPNSIITYYQLEEEEKLKTNEQRILDIIKRHPAGITIRAISRQLNWPDNWVSGRTKSLKDKGLIQTGETILNIETGRPADLLTIT